jgi:hypothetical protein
LRQGFSAGFPQALKRKPQAPTELVAQRWENGFPLDSRQRWAAMAWTACHDCPETLAPQFSPGARHLGLVLASAFDVGGIGVS